MSRMLTLAFILGIILLGMLTLASNIQQVRAIEPIYIRSDGSIDPPTSPLQRNGDLYTLTGNISSDTAAIVIERNNIVLDGAWYTIQGLGSSGSADHAGIILTGRNNVTIRNVNTTEFSVGIRVYQSTNLNISGNTLTNNINWGIYLWDSHGNHISKNNLTDNENQGIDLTDSSNNNLTGNQIANSQLGLILSSGSSNNRIVGNIFINNGLHVYASYGNTVEGNAVNGKPLVYLEGASDSTVNDAGQVILVNCHNIRAENLSVSNTSVGLELWGTSHSRIANNSMSSNLYGIYLGGSSNNSIMENQITTNKECGIYLHSSTNCTILENNVVNNTRGVELDESSSNNIIRNSITGCGGPGISLNGVDGPANYNRIRGNDVENNNYGIHLHRSSNNKIYHNNFIDNTAQASVTESNDNIWHDGYFSGGNYWSDHSVIDEKCGPNQDQPGSDGIRDTPRSLGASNSDRYPLADIYSIVPSYPIAVFDYLPSHPISGQAVIFDASNSTSPNGTITTYYWSLGDGTFSGGSMTTHEYASYGEYKVTLTAISNSRSLSNQTKWIYVREKPTASFQVSPTINLSASQVITFNASASDPRGGNITDCIWDFGDQTTTSTAVPVVTHTYSQAKTYNVTLVVLDSEDLNSSYFRMIKVWMPTFLSISASPSTTFAGFTTIINGTLCDVYGIGLENQTIILYYTFPGAEDWLPITSDTTDQLGKYYVNWIPPATGFFTLRAEWAGNTTHFAADVTVSLSTLPYQDEYVFSATSNSTVSSFSFDSESRELKFDVTGPSGTIGYVNVCIAKDLITNIEDVEVKLNDEEVDFTVTSLDDSWLLHFTYQHSTHEVTITLGQAAASFIETLPGQIVVLSAISFIAIVAAAFAMRRRQRSNDDKHALTTGNS